MNKSLQAKVMAHAAEAYPRECCGLLVAVGDSVVYFPCRNDAAGNEHFILNAEDYAAADDMGEIVAVVHSHPDAACTPSQADYVACTASGFPWHIVSYPQGEWAYIQPNEYKAPLIGREFYHGVLDCYSLIRDWYREERGITLINPLRENEWWYKGQNLYMENFPKAGFVRVPEEELQVGDVILMQVLADVANHAAVYIGDDLILHHLYGKLSCRDIYGGYWRKHTVAVLRYAGIAENHIGGGAGA